MRNDFIINIDVAVVGIWLRFLLRRFGLYGIVLESEVVCLLCIVCFSYYFRVFFYLIEAIHISFQVLLSSIAIMLSTFFTIHFTIMNFNLTIMSFTTHFVLDLYVIMKTIYHAND